MNRYNSRGNDTAKTFYDILEVPVDADAATIRKSYLKKSLKYHPDKNPNNQQEAKAKFIEVGEAYETLSDPVKRRAYDKEQRAAGGRKTDGSTKRPYTNVSDNDLYESYVNKFDSTVAGMSEAELAAAIGAVSALAGLVGSVIGSHVLGGSNKGQRHGIGASVLSSTASVVGGFVASEITSSSLRALHQDSIDRLNYKEDCRRAVERGEPIPERPQTSFIGNKIGDILKTTMDSVSGMGTDASMDNNDGRKNFYGSNHNNNMDQSNAKDERDNVNGFGTIWKMAAAGLKAAQAAKQK